MGRNAKIGLFLLMGLVVALARLVEVEVGKVRGQPEPLPLLVKPEAPPKPHRPHHHGKHPFPSAPPALVVLPHLPAAPAHAQALPPATDEPAGVEWPKGPIYTVKK